MMSRHLNRRSWGATCVILSGVLLSAVLGCSGSTNDRLDELPDDSALSDGTPSAEHFADAVRIVGDGHTPDETREATAVGLVHYFDDIATAAAEDSQDLFSRPDIVRLTVEIGHNDQAIRDLADSMIAWIIRDLEPALSREVTDSDRSLPDLDGHAQILGAIETGVDESPSDMDGREFGRIVIDNVTNRSARAIASSQGLPEPEPGEQPDIVSRHFPRQGNPISDLAMQASNEYETYDADDHW